MSEVSKKYSSPEVISAPSTKGSERSSFERRVFAALLVGKQFAEVLRTLTWDGRDVVKELSVKLAQTVSV